jgi:hypothetical protein
MRSFVLSFLIFGLFGAARAAVCCPDGCVPLNQGLACVKDAVGTPCGNGVTCNAPGSGGGGQGGSGGGVSGYNPPGPVCATSVYCSYANGVAKIGVNVDGGGVIYHGPQPPQTVYTRVVYAKGCVGAGATVKVPFGKETTLNLYNLNYHAQCTNEVPMSFRARVGEFPEANEPCGCDLPLPAPAYGPNTCRQGYIWRGAVAGDNVCVVPARHDAVLKENAARNSTRAGQGTYGPNTCKPGFVWRAAVPSDAVCVTPASREQVKAENASAWDRVAHIAGQ